MSINDEKDINNDLSITFTANKIETPPIINEMAEKLLSNLERIRGTMEVKRIFISQPMKDLPEEEIKRVRAKAEELIIEETPDYEIEFIDSYFEEFLVDETANVNIPLLYLSKSLAKLASADIAVFVNDYYSSRGCKIEYDAATAYGIQTVTIKVV